MESLIQNKWLSVWGKSPDVGGQSTANTMLE